MKEEYVEFFMKHQDRLFPEVVAETFEEAEELLEDCMAEVLESIDEVRGYFEDNGMDVSELSDEELMEEAEVFALPDGNYLVVCA